MLGPTGFRDLTLNQRCASTCGHGDHAGAATRERYYDCGGCSISRTGLMVVLHHPAGSTLLDRCATGARTRQHRMPLTTEVRSRAGRREWWTSTYEPDRSATALFGCGSASSLHFRIAQLQGTGPVGKGELCRRRCEAREQILTSQRSVLWPCWPRRVPPSCASTTNILVSRFRSSQNFAARSHANFGIKGTLANL
jgi:hypothetical protein